MNSTTATPTRRRTRSGPLPTVYVQAQHTISRRGLPWSMYYGTCAACQRRRAFTRPGERVCACGARLLLIVRSEVA